MSALEVNKIIASIIVAIIVIAVIAIIGELAFNSSDNEIAQNAYKIEIVDEQSNKEGSESNIMLTNEAISPLLAKASLENGEKIFKKCGACHTYNKGGANKVGPNLWNIVNQSKAGVSGFAYSRELAEYGGDWNFEELSQFLLKPKEYIKGTKMNFSGLKKSQDRADLILFLRKQADKPATLP